MYHKLWFITYTFFIVLHNFLCIGLQLKLIVDSVFLLCGIEVFEWTLCLILGYLVWNAIDYWWRVGGARRNIIILKFILKFQMNFICKYGPTRNRIHKILTVDGYQWWNTFSWFVSLIHLNLFFFFLANCANNCLYVFDVLTDN